MLKFTTVVVIPSSHYGPGVLISISLALNWTFTKDPSIYDAKMPISPLSMKGSEFSDSDADIDCGWEQNQTHSDLP